MENRKIEIIWDSVIEDVIGDKDPKNVTGIKIKNVKSNKIDELKIDGFYLLQLAMIQQHSYLKIRSKWIVKVI